MSSLPGPDWIESVVDENFAATLLGEAVAGGELAAFLCDDGLAYVAVNDAACVLTGYSSEELLRLSVPDLVVAPDEELLLAARDLSVGTDWRGTWRLRRKDGRTVDVTFVSQAAYIGGLDGFIFTLCWPPNDGGAQRARRWAAELQEEARALREQAALQIARARARTRAGDGST
jgi:PAS domain S-box-containing protein